LIISALRMKPEKTFQLMIPLCQLVAMQMVQPTLFFDVQFLEQEFATRYLDGVAVLYMSTMNEVGESAQFTIEEMDVCRIHYGSKKTSLRST